ERRARARHHAGADALAKPRIGYAHHGGVAHLRMLIENFLDLARIDVGPAADQHLLLAADDLQIATLVEDAEIAGVEPAIGAERLVSLRIVVIADGDGGTTRQDLAGDAGRCLP